MSEHCEAHPEDEGQYQPLYDEAYLVAPTDPMMSVNVIYHPANEDIATTKVFDPRAKQFNKVKLLRPGFDTPLVTDATIHELMRQAGLTYEDLKSHRDAPISTRDVIQARVALRVSLLLDEPALKNACIPTAINQLKVLPEKLGMTGKVNAFVRNPKTSVLADKTIRPPYLSIDELARETGLRMPENSEDEYTERIRRFFSIKAQGAQRT